MRIKTSYAIAAFLALALIGWLWSGQIDKDKSDSESIAVDQAEVMTETVAIDVQVRDLVAEPIAREIIANGKTAANRTVQLRGEASGRVMLIGPSEGELVRRGDLLVTLDPRDREVAILEAKAILRQRQIELDAAKKLNERGFQAETNVALAEANYASAEAALRRAELDLDYTRIRAPFDGVLDHRSVEIGDFVDIGEPIATILDLDPILVTGEVIETEVGRLKLGMSGTARLATGQTVSGTLRYISSQADDQTRTFSIELEVPNADGQAAIGTSAELKISAERLMAHQISPSALSLSDDGRLGVKTVDETNKVVFMPVGIARAEERSVWLTGLPDQIRVITVGQGFVSDGSHVRPIPEASVTAEPVVSEVAR
ncbi:MAG: efflux RND transporter periplasmic adaptor subunit [Geminicoccaceae bacterium]